MKLKKSTDGEGKVNITCQTNKVSLDDNLVWIIVPNNTLTAKEKGKRDTNDLPEEDILMLTASKTYNNKAVGCFISGNSEWRDEITLDVKGRR